MALVPGFTTSPAVDTTLPEPAPWDDVGNVQNVPYTGTSPYGEGLPWNDTTPQDATSGTPAMSNRA